MQHWGIIKNKIFLALVISTIFAFSGTHIQESFSDSTTLTGNLFIAPPFPLITSLVANDPNNNVGFGNGDVITVTFDKATNRPPAATKTDLQNLFTFSQNLGNDFIGSWTSASVLQITIVDDAGATPPTIGSLTLTVKASGNLRNEQGTSFPSTSISSSLTGDFGTRAGPSITSLIASDPNNDDAIYDAGDRIIVRFSENTNKPPVSSKGDLDKIFEYTQEGSPAVLGAAYSGIWANARTLQITIVSPATATVSTASIGHLSFTVKATGNLKNQAETSLASTAVSPPLSGTFGTAAGPFFLSLVANDPDGGDAVYGAGDTITATFSAPTNQPFGPSLDKANLDSLFTFSQNLGADYTGVWTNPVTLVITIQNPSGAAPPSVGTLQLTVKSGGNLRGQANTSLPSVALSSPLSGNFGTKAGPAIVSLVASDPKNPVGNSYDNGDIITVTFNEPTNRPPVGSVANLKSLFDFKQGIAVASLGTSYSGSWVSPSVLKITVSDTTGHSSPTPGSLTLTVKASANLKNTAGTSLASTSTSPTLSGNFGIRNGPAFTSLVASDPANDDAVFSAGDKITARFNAKTNTPPVNSKSALDALFTFSQYIGDDYSGIWTNPTTLVITILDDTVDTPPKVGELQLTAKQSGNLQLQVGSQPSTAVSPALGGTFGTAPGPSIVDLVAKDPFGSDAVFGKDDTMTLSFGVPTNRIAGTVLSQSQVNDLYSFSTALDGSFTGRWFDSQTFVITFLSSGTISPQVGSFSVTVNEAANLKNKADNSLPSASSSPLLRGDFGTKAGPAITEVVGADPKTTKVLGLDAGDTITITFDESTNQPAVATKSDIDTVFSFSKILGADYTGAWFNPSKLVITVNDAGGNNMPIPPDLTVTVLAGGNLKNSANTSLASESIFTSISGNFGQRAGPNIISLVADDPKGTIVPGFDNSDTITVIFSEKTNQPAVNTKNALDDLFTFSQAIGDDYSGVWTANGDLVITILDGEQLTEPPVVGDLQVVVKGTGNLRAQNGSEPSTAVSPFLSGNFGGFIEEVSLCEGGDAFATFPDGKTAEISFAGDECGGFTFEGADEETSERIEFLGDFVTISPTGGTDCSVSPFCTISFVFREDDIPPDTEEPITDNIKIFKDVNEDGDIDQEDPDTSVEVFNGLPPGTPQTTVVALDDVRFEASATTPSNSKFAIGGIKALAIGALGPSVSAPSAPSTSTASAGAGAGSSGGGGNAGSIGEEGGFAGAIDISQVKLYEVTWDKCDEKMLKVIAGPAGPGLSVKAVAAMGGIIAMKESSEQPFTKATVYETPISDIETFIRVQVEGVIGREASLAQRSFDLNECTGGIGGYSEYEDIISPASGVPIGSFPSTASLFEDGSMFDTKYNDLDFGVGYWMPEGQITQMDVDEEAKSITFGFSDKIKGRLVLSLPQGMISAEDDKFILLNPTTSQQISYEIIESGSQYVTLEMTLPEEIGSITVIGTNVVPEFGSVTLAILIISIISLVLISRTKVLPTLG